jgi:hypothetical protein
MHWQPVLAERKTNHLKEMSGNEEESTAEEKRDGNEMTTTVSEIIGGAISPIRHDKKSFSTHP